MISSPDGGRTPPLCKDVNVTVSLDQLTGEVHDGFVVPKGEKEVKPEWRDPQMAPLDKGAESDKNNKGGFSPYLCQHIGMLEGVRYNREHPLWRPVRWSCPAPGKHQQDI
jgi:hypothetical protein